MTLCIPLREQLLTASIADYYLCCVAPFIQPSTINRTSIQMLSNESVKQAGTKVNLHVIAQLIALGFPPATRTPTCSQFGNSPYFTSARLWLDNGGHSRLLFSQRHLQAHADIQDGPPWSPLTSQTCRVRYLSGGFRRVHLQHRVPRPSRSPGRPPLPHQIIRLFSLICLDGLSPVTLAPSPLAKHEPADASPARRH